MNPINTTFHHDTLGKLRTIYTGDDLLFALCDVSRILGYRDNGKALRNVCRNVKKYDYCTKSMLFMSSDDINDLCENNDSPEAEELLDWIVDIIIPEVDKAFVESEPDETVENPMLVIYRSSLTRLVFSYTRLCERFAAICEFAESVPVCEGVAELKREIRECKEECEAVFANSGLPCTAMEDFDVEELLAFMNTIATYPEAVGYIKLDDAVDVLRDMGQKFMSTRLNANG